MGGGPGIRVHQFPGGGPRRRPTTAQPNGTQQQPSLSSTLSSLLPLLFLFVLPLLSSLFSSGSQDQGPSVVFESPRGTNTHARTSSQLKIPYWVRPNDVTGYTKRDWSNLDTWAEKKYIHTVNVNCEKERYQQSKLEQEAQGWLFVDEVKLRQARDLPMPYCRRLRELGIR